MLRPRPYAAVVPIAVLASSLTVACTSSAPPALTGSRSTTSTVTTRSTPSSSDGSVTVSITTAPTTSTSPGGSATSSDTPDPAQAALARLSLAQKVGQLFMVDCPSSGVASATITAIRRDHVGSVILDGNSTLGVQRTRAITGRLQGYAPRSTRLFISTDQEGGLVQRMKGPGFSTIPSAVAQGRVAPVQLRDDARIWGRQLRKAGINVDLAPVLDTVPPGSTDNPPIGDLDREYGRTPLVVARHGVAVAQGLADARISATAKHFPGLGRVTGNTDTTSGVTDHVTTRHDAYLKPFTAAVRHHIGFVMMSTAIYARIDPGTPAAFSRTIVTGMLRHDLGFGGIIITDDVGAAKQVSGYSPAQRALRFIGAGGTMLLTVTASVIPAMERALITRAKHSATFARKIDAAALIVLRAKHARGLA